jgi:hypothetical protein
MRSPRRDYKSSRLSYRTQERALASHCPDRLWATYDRILSRTMPHLASALAVALCAASCAGQKLFFSNLQVPESVLRAGTQRPGAFYTLTASEPLVIDSGVSNENCISHSVGVI